MNQANIIHYGGHLISQADIQVVVYEIRLDFITQGPVVNAFKEAVTTYWSVWCVAITIFTKIAWCNTFSLSQIGQYFKKIKSIGCSHCRKDIV
jgi:hypothetical protein